MVNERSVYTNEGEVSYETVTCCSCGDEVAKQNCKRCVIGDLRKESNLSTFNKHKYEFASKPDVGWLCQFCHEEPAAYPHRDDTTGRSKPDRGRWWHFCKFIKGDA